MTDRPTTDWLIDWSIDWSIDHLICCLVQLVKLVPDIVQIPSTPAENMVREEQVGNLFIDFSKLQTGDEFSGDQDVDVPVNTVRSGEIPTHAVYQQDRPQRQKGV